MRVFVSMLVLSSSFCFTACSNDDENTPQLPDEVTTGTMFGNYTGKMLISSLSPTEKENNEEAPVGVDISATVNNDTVYFEKFPIKDIVLSIVKDETLTDKIVEAVGDVNYKVGYKPTLTAAKDSIKFVLNPESLYYVSCGNPVFAMTGSNEAVLVVGYDANNVIIFDPSSGNNFKQSITEAEEVFKGAGNVFFTYLK